MTTQYPGIKALEMLNSFLNVNDLSLLDGSSYEHSGFDREYRHPTMSRGNAIVPISELRKKAPHLAFGGDLHGVLRGLGGALGQLLDETALPENVRTLFVNHRASLDAYQATVKAMETELKARLPDGEAPVCYSSREQLDSYLWVESYLSGIGSAGLDALRENLNKATSLEESAWSQLNLGLSVLPYVPLKFCYNGAEYTTQLPNSGSPPLATLLCMNDQSQYGQFSSLVRPRPIEGNGEKSQIISMLDGGLLRPLLHEEGPEAQVFLGAVDAMLQETLARAVVKLEKEYAEELAAVNPDVARQWNRVVGEVKRLIPDAITVAVAEAKKPWKERLGGGHRKDTVPGSLKSGGMCPYHRH